MVTNAKTLATELSSLGYKVVTGGTDNHIVLVDLSTVKLSGAKAERILELIDISVNKNTGKCIFLLHISCASSKVLTRKNPTATLFIALKP